MATTQSKRTSRAKSPAKAGSTPEQQNADEQANVPPTASESTAAPQSETASPAGEPPATPVTDAGEETPPAASQDEQASGNTPGEALPTIDPDAGERTAEGVNGSGQGGENDEPAGEIPALFVRTRKSILRRRRAGHVFTPEGHGIALSGLADDEIQALQADPTLVVEECTFPAEAED